MLTNAKHVADHLQIETDIYDDLTTIQCYLDCIDTDAKTLDESRALLQKAVSAAHDALTALQSTLALIDGNLVR